MRNKLSIFFIIIMLASLGIAQIGVAETTKVEIWRHSGHPVEQKSLNEIIHRFNKAHDGIKAEITYITETEYESKIATAAVAGKLPDIMDYDGPRVASIASKGFLKPLGKYFTEEELKDFLPGRKKRWNDKLWAVGMQESGLALFYRKDLLNKINVEAPKKLENAWLWSDFTEVCEKAKKELDINYPVDIHWQWAAAWWTYGFSPIVWSNGGSLVGPKGIKTTGYMNSPESVEALEKFQDFIEAGYASPEATPGQFKQGEALFSWAGNWMYAPFKDKFGDKLGITFLPGINKPVTGSGTYAWMMTKDAENLEATAKVLKWLVKPESILIYTRGTDFSGNRISGGTAGPPARRSVYQYFPAYQKYPMKIYAIQFQKGVTHARPSTPAYGIITSNFWDAMNDIAHGADVKKTLTKTAKGIDSQIAEQDYFGLKEEG